MKDASLLFQKDSTSEDESADTSREEVGDYPSVAKINRDTNSQIWESY